MPTLSKKFCASVRLQMGQCGEVASLAKVVVAEKFFHSGYVKCPSPQKDKGGKSQILPEESKGSLGLTEVRHVQYELFVRPRELRGA